MSIAMIDLETLGVRTSSVVLSLGVVVLANDGEIYKFYAQLNVDDQTHLDRTIDSSTLDFWMKQKDEAKKDVFNGEGDATFCGLIGFVNFMKEFDDDIKVYGNGSDFDISMIISLLESFGVKPTWKFWNHRCYRTLKSMLPNKVKLERVGTYHNALDDAESQLNHLIALCEANNIKL